MRANLINARNEHQLTQAEMAEKLNISTRHYRTLEAGTSEGSVKVWNKLKEILNAPSIDHLLEQEDTPSIAEKESNGEDEVAYSLLGSSERPTR